MKNLFEAMFQWFIAMIITGIIAGSIICFIMAMYIF